MTPITAPLVDTAKLTEYAAFLRDDCKKITDALFVENLITAINTHPGADSSCVDRWLRAAFAFPADFNKYNCIDVYNSSFYHSLLEKI